MMWRVGTISSLSSRSERSHGRADARAESAARGPAPDLVVMAMSGVTVMSNAQARLRTARSCSRRRRLSASGRTIRKRASSETRLVAASTNLEMTRRVRMGCPNHYAT